MSSETDGYSSRDALVEALEVRQNAKRGLAVGLLFTAAVFYLFVLAPAGTIRSPLYYVALGFVLALTMSGLATVVLVAVRAYRLAGELGVTD